MDASFRKMADAIEAKRDMILEAERYLWKHPESGYREWNTHAYLKERYEALGLPVHEAGNIPGFYCDIDTGRPGPKLGIFGEMDSLIIPMHPECDPETGAVHACGHHCQSAALLGVAVALSAPGALDGMCGSIRLFAVPAEELIEVGFRRELMQKGIIRFLGGKQEFLYRGYLNGVDLAMVVHTSSVPGLTCTVGSNGCVTKIVEFYGKSVHAAAPSGGNNALYAATCAMNACNALRETFPDAGHIRFHPILTAAGSAVNAIPEKVVMESYVRGATWQAIKKANEQMNRAIAGSAAAMGCRVRFTDMLGYAPRVNDRNFCEVFHEVGKEFFSEEEMNFTRDFAAGCSDMGDISSVMPSVHPNIGGAAGGAHSSAFHITDPVLACVTSAKVQAGVAQRLLLNGGEAVKKIVAEANVPFSSVEEYLREAETLNFEGDGVTYHDDGTVTLKYKA